MGASHPNYRRIKTLRPYKAEELATLLGVHKNTIRNWQRQGLTADTQRRPALFDGRAVAEFLRKRRAGAKQPCKPGESYCVGCRAPKFPAGSMADFVPLSERHGTLRALCPDCEGMIYRRARVADLPRFARLLDLKTVNAQPRLTDSSRVFSNCHLKAEGEP